MKHSLFVGVFSSIYIYGTYRMYKEVFNIHKKPIVFKCIGK